ncbi:MAG: basic rane protein [Bacillota bacterium]|nr:basic rane protein [Bacillota bacterium]
MVKVRRWVVLVGMAVVLSLVMVGAGGLSFAASKFKVGFIYVGPIGDAGWTYAHNEGRKYLEAQLPNVETVYVESVPEGGDCERVLTQLAEAGCKVIFATSFGYMDFVQNVAARYPDVVFMHCSGFKTAKNVGTYFGRMYQPRYLTGLVAGKMTRKNLIGYVAAHPIPEVVRGINAFTLGVRAVNPKAKVKVVWTNTWYDPAAEKEAAKSLLEAGCDVIAQHQDTPAPMQAAEEKGCYGVGYNTDMRQFAPKAVLTAPVWNWGPYYVKTVKAVLDGTWKTEEYWGGMEDGVVDIGPYGPMVPEDVKKLVAQKKQEIIAGKLVVFAGPLKDNKGVLRVPAGKAMTDAEMLSFDWFVEGVDGTVPK